MTDTKNVVVLNNRRETKDEAATWSPRETLLDMLREIDEGLEVTELVICYDVGIRGTGFRNATTTFKSAIGLLQVTQLEMFHKGAHFDDV